MNNLKSKLLLTLSLVFLFTVAIVSTSERNAYAAHPIETKMASGATNNSTTIQNSNDVQQSENATETKNNVSKPLAGSGKSQVIALILCVLLGGLGIHRFYLGYTWQGVVQLLTGGGCGVWALIDLIRIIMGDLKPKGGNYDKTL
jgi:TM2 domain-containing membrane protein YozV